TELWERSLIYLIREVEGWNWLDPQRRRQLLDEYGMRRARLRQPAAPPPPIVTPPPLTIETPAQPPAEVPPPLGAGQPLAHLASSLSGFLEEKNIRWFHTLGGL